MNLTNWSVCDTFNQNLVHLLICGHLMRYCKPGNSTAKWVMFNNSCTKPRQYLVSLPCRLLVSEIHLLFCQSRSVSTRKSLEVYWSKLRAQFLNLFNLGGHWISQVYIVQQTGRPSYLWTEMEISNIRSTSSVVMTSTSMDVFTQLGSLTRIASRCCREQEGSGDDVTTCGYSRNVQWQH